MVRGESLMNHYNSIFSHSLHIFGKASNLLGISLHQAIRGAGAYPIHT